MFSYDDNVPFLVHISLANERIIMLIFIKAIIKNMYGKLKKKIISTTKLFAYTH